MAMIVDALASQFAETLADLIKEEVSMLLGVKDELQRLNMKVGTIRTVLEDAERKAFTNRPIRAWLAELKDIVYDADDLIDRCRIHGQKLARLSLEQSSSSISVRCFSPFLSCFRRVAFRHQIGGSIRSINDRLERIIKNKSDFDLTSAARDDRGRSTILRQTDPGLETDIVGMGVEIDTSNLVGLLTAEGIPAISIIAIVGMGGIGKTTLAQKIYNHKTIRDNFQMPPPMWVCVSQDYSETNLMKEIIRCAGGHPGDAQTLGELEPILSRLIEQKKFFLILDDVWSAQVWENLLRKPLQRGAAGSRVLITTRDERVAKEMGAVHLHTVQPLSMVDGWSLLCKMVFQEGQGGIETVGDIGMQIVEKCHGLPLALKTIAGVLRTKDKTRWEWEKVLHNQAWSITDLPNGVMGVLYLSYQDLPFHLKQCFVYCSLFPEDHVFMRHTLIQHWVAEGFIKEEGDMIMEEVARGYYRDLLRRSLLQADPRYYDDGACKVHDLLRSLAQFLVRDENFVGDVKGLVKATTTASSSTKLRRLSVVDMELTTVPEVVKEQKSLRTLLFMDFEWIEDLPQDLFEKLGCLRVLNFSGTDFTKVPDSVGNLIHLRYLDLSGSSIEALPETIVSLSNLQYLILQSCVFLQSLPKGIAKLYNMRSLDLLHTPVSGLPVGIGRLQHLNRLMGFVTNESTDCCSLEEIGSLFQLRSLTLGNLEGALMRTKGRGFFLKDKRHLRHLELYCTPMRADGQPFGEEEVKKIREVFEEELFPPPYLEKFEIKGYFGLQYPSWIMTSGAVSPLFNLRRLDLTDCLNCRQLPPLGLLPNLDLLNIKGASAIESIGPELMGNGGGVVRRVIPSYVPFPKLKSLKLKNMPNWVQWLWEAEDAAVAMPRLESLKLVNCPNLRSLPGGLLHHTTALTALWIQRANSLSAIENFASVKGLVVSENGILRRVSNLPALQVLNVNGCPYLEDVGDLNSLQSLSLHDLEMDFLPEWLQPPFPAVDRVYIIVRGVDVLRRCLVGGPDWPKIQHFCHVYIQAYSGPEFLFYTKDPFTFNTNLGAGGGDGGNESTIANPEI